MTPTPASRTTSPSGGTSASAPVIGVDTATGLGTGQGLQGKCPCGVEFRIAFADPDGVDPVVAAVHAHAADSHGTDLSRELILSKLTAY